MVIKFSDNLVKYKRRKQKGNNKMSNSNMVWFQDAVKQYNLQGIQLIPNKQGNTCLSVIYRAEKYKTGTLNKKACYELIKALACNNTDKIEEQGKSENQVQFTKNDTVYLNGKKYTIWEIIKDIKPCRLYSEFLYKKDMTQKQKELAYKIKQFLDKDNNGEYYLLCHLQDLDFSLTDEEIQERKDGMREYIKETWGA